MKIIKIEPISGTEMTFIKNKITLSSVIITKKTFFGNEKTMIAHPTNYGPTYRSHTIIFFKYVDENGKEYPDNVSKQINNFLRIPINKIN